MRPLLRKSHLNLFFGFLIFVKSISAPYASCKKPTTSKMILTCLILLLIMCKNGYLSFVIYVIADYVKIANRECDSKADIMIEYWLFKLVDSWNVIVFTHLICLCSINNQQCLEVRTMSIYWNNHINLYLKVSMC